MRSSLDPSRLFGRTLAQERLSRQLCAALRATLTGVAVSVPEGGLVWIAIFTRLSEARSWQAHGPNPISFSDIEAFSRLMRVPFEASHVQLILDLDRTWLSHTYAKWQHGATAPAGSKVLPPISKHGLTAQLFDLAIG